jgi:hypothetical protein
MEDTMTRLLVSLLVPVIMLLLSHMDTMAQQQSGKVYWMSTAVVPLGRLQDYHAFAQKEYVPTQEKYGWRFVAGWQTIVGDIEEVISVAEFDDMNAYLKARVSLLGSPEWKALAPKFDAFIKGARTRLMTALPYYGISK